MSIFDNPNPITDGLKKVKIVNVDWMRDKNLTEVQWPSMGDEKYCSDCIQWTRKRKTHGNWQCGHREKHYCLAHGKCYWRARWAKEEDLIEDFLTQEDMEI